MVRLLSIKILILLSLVATLCRAQEENSYRWEASFSGGLNTDGWEIFGGVHWMPLPYVGIGASVGFDSEIKELSDWGRDEYDGTYNDDYCIRFLFKPSLLLRTPRLFSISSQDLDFHLFASPGIIMSPHASGAKNSGWLYWTGAVGVTAIADRFTISLGYSYSDFSLLDGNPRTHHGNYGDDRKHYTHSAFLTLGYKF